MNIVAATAVKHGLFSLPGLIHRNQRNLLKSVCICVLMAWRLSVEKTAHMVRMAEQGSDSLARDVLRSPHHNLLHLDAKSPRNTTANLIEK